MSEFNWNRYLGGKQVSTGRGERIRAWFHKRVSHTFAFGVTFRAVIFADHRSGWSGVKMNVALGWWGFSWMLLKWKTSYQKPYTTITLAEQIRRTHGTSLEEQEKEEEERERKEKADEKARLELFDKQLKEYDARHQQPDTEQEEGGD